MKHGKRLDSPPPEQSTASTIDLTPDDGDSTMRGLAGKLWLTRLLATGRNISQGVLRSRWRVLMVLVSLAILPSLAIAVMSRNIIKRLNRAG